MGSLIGLIERDTRSLDYSMSRTMSHKRVVNRIWMTPSYRSR